MKLRFLLVAVAAAVAIPLLATAACSSCCHTSEPPPPHDAGLDAAPDALSTVFDASCDALPDAPGPVPASTFVIVSAPPDAASARCVPETEVVRGYVVIQRACGG